MSLPPQQITSVRWAAVFPWLILVRAARVALMMRVILLALLGVAATYGGWLLLESSLLGEHELRGIHLKPLSWTYAPQPLDLPIAAGDGTLGVRSRYAPGPLASAWHWIVQPFVGLVQAGGWRVQTSLALAGVWSVAVWGLFGGAIARIGAVYLTYGETIGPLAALRASARRWRSTVGAPLLVALAALLLALPLALAGLLLRFDVMALLLGLAWIVAIVAGAALAVVALGLAFGWPLMFSTVAVERTDAFDAISRGFAYLFQRPLHLLFYVVVASLLGMLAQVAVELAVTATIVATDAAVSVGAGEGRLGDLGVDGSGASPDVSDVGAFGGAAIQFWTGALRAAAVYFPLAYFWPATTAIYLLLRRGVDGAETTDIEFDEGEAKPGLPQLTPNATTGVPQVERPAETTAPA